MRAMIYGMVLVLMTGTIGWADGVIVGGNGKLCWLPNAELDIAAYKAHIGSTTGNYTDIQDVGIPSVDPIHTPKLCVSLTADLGLSEGQHYAAMSAVDLAGNSSGVSVEAPFLLDLTGPAVPGGISVESN